MAGKSVTAQERDVRKAADLLDHLLSITLVSHLSNLTLATQRIQLAHRLADSDYLCAMGWIMARRLATVPARAEQMKELYRAPLGTSLKPYARRDPQGRLRFSSDAIGRGYREARKQMGDGIFPVEYRRK